MKQSSLAAALTTSGHFKQIIISLGIGSLAIIATFVFFPSIYLQALGIQSNDTSTTASAIARPANTLTSKPNIHPEQAQNTPQKTPSTVAAEEKTAPQSTAPSLQTNTEDAKDDMQAVASIPKSKQIQAPEKTRFR